MLQDNNHHHHDHIDDRADVDDAIDPVVTHGDVQTNIRSTAGSAKNFLSAQMIVDFLSSILALFTSPAGIFCATWSQTSSPMVEVK